MKGKEPTAELAPQFSSPDAKPRPWAEARALVEKAEVYWLTTVRPDGRPHVTSLFGIWLDDAFNFCTGDRERKAKNLAQNVHCVITTGSHVNEGLDVVLEGDAARVRDKAKLQRLADMWKKKYDWNWTVRDDAFVDAADGSVAPVYEVDPTMAFGFGKGAVPSQTRWRFGPDPAARSGPSRQ